MLQQQWRDNVAVMKRWLVAAAVLGVAACGWAAAPSCDVADVRAEIEAVLAETGRATRAQDIDAYMRLIPEGALIDDTSGEQIDREALRANVLRDWAVIPETIALEHTVESVEMRGCDEAIAMVGQRWERTMTRPNNAPGVDRILTTQRHRETWRRTADGWRAFHIEELGGEIYVNGELYAPN